VKAISGLFCVAGFIALCVVSFNYVEAHDSTEVKNENSRLEEKVESLRTEVGDLNTARINMEGRLRQACSALAEHEIEHKACKEEEQPVAAMEADGETSEEEGSGE